MPLAEPHSNAHHLSNHFGLLRVAKHPRRHRGKGMRLQNDFLAGQGAPAAGVAITGFDKVNGPLVLRAPAPFQHLVP